MPKQILENLAYCRNVGFEYRAEYSGGYILYEGWAYPNGQATNEGSLIWEIQQSALKNAFSSLQEVLYMKFIAFLIY